MHTLTLIRSNWLPRTVPLFQSDVIDGNVPLIARASDTFEDDLQAKHGTEPSVRLQWWRTLPALWGSAEVSRAQTRSYQIPKRMSFLLLQEPQDLESRTPLLTGPTPVC